MNAFSAPEIVRRDLHVDFDEVPRHWHGGDCHRTRLFDALSLFFPDGERFFIESVRHYREQVPPQSELAKEVRGFIGQEAIHSREHHRYNEWLDTQGVPATSLEAFVLARLDFIRRITTPEHRLAITLCLEHFTALLADQLLRHDEGLAEAHPQMRRLWRWHAMEETEHKAVAFDVYQAVLGRGIRPTLRRCLAMLDTSFFFTWYSWRYLIKLVRADGQGRNWGGWLRLLHFMFVNPGPFLRILPGWLAWFRPGFHPWQHDNRRLLETAYRQYEMTGESAG